MINIIGVRFRKAYKIYYFDPNGIQFNPGDGVIVETVKGVEYGIVVIGNREVDESSIVNPLKPIIRKATDKDEAKLFEISDKEENAFNVCKTQIEKHKLVMKLISAEYTFDLSKVVLSFTADGRVDFRELVKDLAAILKTRIELRQIGVRDETKILGGLGPCGRPCCCSVFLGDFQPVSIKMAKEQKLSLSPTKISGLCGRLMCCLNYEEKYYEEMHKLMPFVGSTVTTPDGKGIVVDTNPLKKLVRVRIESEDQGTEQKDYPLDKISFKKIFKKKDMVEEEIDEKTFFTQED